MATKAEKLRALIWSYANNSRAIPPTPNSVQTDIQRMTGTLYGTDVITRYLCDWYIARDIQRINHQYAKSQRSIELALASLDIATEALKQVQSNFGGQNESIP